MPRDDRLRGRPREGRRAHQHLVHDARQTVFVAAAVDLTRSRGLLGAHVRRRADDGPGLCEVVLIARRAHGARDAEVGHYGRAAREHDVLWLDVPMYDSAAVCVRQRPRYLGGDAERILLRELLLARQAIAQGLPLDVGHHVIEEPGRRPGVVQGQDVGMLQPRGDLDLAQEALGAELRGELRVEHLDRDRPMVLQILREEHRRHAPPTELTLDRVAVGESLTKGVEQIGHGMWGLAYSAPQPHASVAAPPPLLSCRPPFPYL